LSGAQHAGRLQRTTNALNVASQDQIKMASVVVSLKIMPESPKTDLSKLESEVKKKIVAYSGETQTKTDIQPIAFGLSALNILFVMKEEIGSTEPLEQEIAKIKGVNSVEVTDVRRAVG
jgi:elongation factor 1-beta